MGKIATDKLPVELRERTRDAVVREMAEQLVRFFYEATQDYRFIPTTAQMQVSWELRTGDGGLHVVMRGNVASTEHTTMDYPVTSELIAKYISLARERPE